MSYVVSIRRASFMDVKKTTWDSFIHAIENGACGFIATDEMQIGFEHVADGILYEGVANGKPVSRVIPLGRFVIRVGDDALRIGMSLILAQ